MKPEKKNVGHMPQRPTFSGMLWTQCHPWQCQVWTFTVVHTGLSVVIKQKQWTEFFICFVFFFCHLFEWSTIYLLHVAALHKN